ncbi:MAG: hypothetical protein JOZ81_07525 [Chloroflexi bacterium]|nr:hypothetical protein [Chloroflexota bacterium]
MTGSDRVVVDAGELRRLANAARNQRSRVQSAEGRAAAIIASIDPTGWDAGAATGMWPGVKGALDGLEADLDTLAWDLERRAALVDMVDTPFSAIAGLPLIPFGFSPSGNLQGFPNPNMEWRQLMAELPPGWQDLARQQQLALIDQIQLGQLGYKPFAAPPPPVSPNDGGGFSIGGLFNGAVNGLGDAASWTADQAAGFGSTLFQDGKGSVEGIAQLGAAAFRDTVNGINFISQGGLSHPLQGPGPLLPGPSTGDIVSKMPSAFLHGVTQPFKDFANGKIGAGAAGIIWLAGPKLFRVFKDRLPSPPTNPEPAPPDVPPARVGAPSATVWDHIQPTDANWPATKIPRSFNVEVGGTYFHVTPNATEHIKDYVASTPSATAPVESQIELANLRAVLAKAQAQKIKYDQLVVIDGWEIKIGPPRTGPYPTVYHFRKASGS